METADILVTSPVGAPAVLAAVAAFFFLIAEFTRQLARMVAGQ